MIEVTPLKSVSLTIDVVEYIDAKTSKQLRDPFFKVAPLASIADKSGDNRNIRAGMGSTFVEIGGEGSHRAIL